MARVAIAANLTSAFAVPPNSPRPKQARPHLVVLGARSKRLERAHIPQEIDRESPSGVCSVVPPNISLPLAGLIHPGAHAPINYTSSTDASTASVNTARDSADA